MMDKMAKTRQGQNPIGSRWGYGDLFLMATKSLRGHTADDICEIFGARPSAVKKAVRLGIKTIGHFQFIFSRSFPTAAEAEDIRQRFEDAGVANPDDIFVGDCTDIPIWSSNGEYFTYKQCCPSKHAIRVRIRQKLLKQCKKTIHVPVRILRIENFLDISTFQSYIQFIFILNEYKYLIFGVNAKSLLGNKMCFFLYLRAWLFVRARPCCRFMCSRVMDRRARQARTPYYFDFPSLERTQRRPGAK